MVKSAFFRFWKTVVKLGRVYRFSTWLWWLWAYLVQLLQFRIYLSSFLDLSISPSHLLTTASTFTDGSFSASTVILTATLAAPSVRVCFLCILSRFPFYLSCSRSLCFFSFFYNLRFSNAFSAANFAGLTTGLWRAVSQDHLLLLES